VPTSHVPRAGPCEHYDDVVFRVNLLSRSRTRNRGRTPTVNGLSRRALVPARAALPSRSSAEALQTAAVHFGDAPASGDTPALLVRSGRDCSGRNLHRRRDGHNSRWDERDFERRSVHLCVVGAEFRRAYDLVSRTC
jgi:hypothetical protein